MPLRWSHAVVYVRDLDAMIDFYSNVLGFEVTDRGPVAPAEGAPEIAFMSRRSGASFPRMIPLASAVWCWSTTPATRRSSRSWTKPSKRFAAPMT